MPFRTPHVSLPVLLLAAIATGNAHAAPAVAPATSAATPSTADANTIDLDLNPLFARWHLGLKGQKQRNTCGVFTITGALEYALAKTINRGVSLSPEYLNWAAAMVDGAGGALRDGSSFATLMQGFQRWGICTEELMPYTPYYDATYRPDQDALDSAKHAWQMGFRWHWIETGDADGLSAANLDAAKDVLRRGYPVCAGGEHCLLVVGYKDDKTQPGGGLFRVRNYATQRLETRSYAETQKMFYTMLWIEAPAARRAPADKEQANSHQ